MSTTITVTSIEQAALLKCELQGQISDGYWENAGPRDHWKQPASAEVLVGPIAKINFYPRRAYNFSAPKLLEYVGDRMRQTVVLKKLFPTLSKEGIGAFDSSGYIFVEATKEGYRQQYYVNLVQELEAVCGVTNQEELQAVLRSERYLTAYVKYSVKELKKDLNAIKAAFKNVQMR